MILTRLLRVDPQDPQAAVLNEAASMLRTGGVVAFPTETFYGLGANALDFQAVGRVYRVKGRAESKPLLVLVDSVRMAESLVKDVSVAARSLMAKYWPGPLTLVFRAVADLPGELTAGTGTIGIRISSHPVALGLVHAAGVPVTAPSANLSGQEPPTTSGDVQQAVGGKIDLILDGGPTKGGLPSTILDVTVTPPRLIRAGALEIRERGRP